MVYRAQETGEKRIEGMKRRECVCMESMALKMILALPVNQSFRS